MERIKLFVGPNQGCRFVAKFLPVGATTTRVAISAFVGKAGFTLGLGKLSTLGMEKAPQKLLQEHQVSIEGYELGTPVIEW